MATTIKLKNGSGAPLTGDLVKGEPALDLTNKRLYTEDSGGSVIEVGTNPTSLTTGTFTSTGIDDNATSTAITIDSSQNVGIGTTNPGLKLDVVNASGSTYANIRRNSQSAGEVGLSLYGGTSGINWTIYQPTSSNDMRFYGNGADRLTIDSSGHVGIRTTPNAWRTTDSVLQLGNRASVTGLANDTHFSNNAYFDTGSTWKAQDTAQAANYYQSAGIHAWRYAGTTTAGAAISWSEAMRIDNSGRVGIGTNVFSNAAQVLVAKGDSFVSTSDANDCGFNFTAVPDTTTGKVGIGFKTHNETAAAVAALYATPISQYRNALTARYNADINGGYFSIEQLVPQTASVIERLRITDSGNVGIGTASPTTDLQIGPAGNYTDSLLTVRNNTNAIDWGHTNTSGFGSTLGASSGSGAPFVGLSCGAGTNANTFRTYGVKGSLLTTDNAGALVFSRVATATADNQTPAESMRLDASGNVLVGTSLNNAKFVVQGVGSTSATLATIMYNASGTGLFYIRDDGAFNTGGAASSPYFNTSATAANLVVNSNGFLERSTSSKRYKENIRDYDQTLSIDALRPVFFNSKKEGDSKTYAGLIAEEVHDAGFTEFVEYNDDGEPDAVFYANMVALCIKEIQDLKAEVAALKGA